MVLSIRPPPLPQRQQLIPHARRPIVLKAGELATRSAGRQAKRHSGPQASRGVNHQGADAPAVENSIDPGLIMLIPAPGRGAWHPAMTSERSVVASYCKR